MAESGEVDLGEREIVEQRHRKERKELQSKIQAIKRAVPKGDKKRKKESMTQIAFLEAELTERHEQEMQEVEKNTVSVMDGITQEIGRLNVDAENAPTQRISKAQRRKNKKEAKEKEREQRIREEERTNVYGPRNVEMQKLKSLLKERGLAVKEIPSDGHCLYNAVNDQLLTQGIESSLEQLRQQTADYMFSHSNDFLPFLTNPDTGDLLTPDEYEKYCIDIASTAVWGGEPEIRALSQVLQKAIEVVQADAPLLTVGEEFRNSTAPAIILIYHKHIYGLGEHYNSIKKLIADESDEEN